MEETPQDATPTTTVDDDEQDSFTPEELEMNVTTAPTKVLIDTYNKYHKGAPIKKFTDRRTAERRVSALLQAAKAKKGSSSKPATKKKKAAPKANGGDRSAGVIASWQDKKVALARSTKHRVRVGGVEYRSVVDAFKQLKLDMRKVLGFRAQLKEKGRATFSDHVFTLVKADE